MGCNTCNGKKQGEMSYDDIPGKEIKLIPSAIADGNFNEMNIILKLVTTVVILMAIPLVLVAITIQFILHMFTPKWLQKIQVKWSLYWKNKIRERTEKNKVIKNTATREKREKQFYDTPTYSAETFSNLEIVEDNEENEE